MTARGNDVAPPGPEAVNLPLHRTLRRRAEVLQSFVDHLPLALALLGAGTASLRRGAEGNARALALLEIAASAWQLARLALATRELVRHERSRRGAAHADDPSVFDAEQDSARVAWGDVAASALLAVSVWHDWATTGRLRGPQLLLATVLLILAFVRPRIRDRSRRLIVGAEGFEHRPRRFRPTRIAWADVATCTLTADELHVVARDGRSFRVRADRYDHGHALLEAVRRALPRFAPALVAAAPRHASDLGTSPRDVPTSS